VVVVSTSIVQAYALWLSYLVAGGFPRAFLFLGNSDLFTYSKVLTVFYVKIAAMRKLTCKFLG